MNPYFFYSVVFVLLLFAELLYFRIADRFNIIDKPNQRSSHNYITIRGGGIIFPLSVLLASFADIEGFRAFFVVGVLLVTTVSFADDIRPISGRIRFLVHLAAAFLVFADIGVLDEPWWIVAIAAIVYIGTLNAYNFMDGINGITGLYSLVALGTLYFIFNADPEGTICYFYSPIPYFKNIASAAAISAIVFLIFNFRKRAKAFCGDVGSISMAFIVLTLILFLIHYTANLKYILLLSVYGVDSVFTIIRRLWLRQNIFEAHRMHLYQFLANEKKIPHLVVSVLYAIVQLAINIIVLRDDFNLVMAVGILSIPALVYFFVLRFVK